MVSTSLFERISLDPKNCLVISFDVIVSLHIMFETRRSLKLSSYYLSKLATYTTINTYSLCRFKSKCLDC